MVAWLERGGDRFLRDQQPDIYQQLLLHVGGTDVLRRYCGTEAYWLHVQTVLDCFFSSAERAAMCRELMDESLFEGDPAFPFFLDRARAELRCRELILLVEEVALGMARPLRSVG